jgi:phenylacetic acid degradation operon negative regulatory protein
MPSRQGTDAHVEDRLSAPEVVLSLVDSALRPDIDVARIIAAGELFDIDPRTIRVALARLVKSGVLASRARGRYGLGPAGGSMHAAVVSWSSYEARVRSWDGRWLAVETGHLQRGERRRVRTRERALRLNGFAAASASLWVRPANLTLSTAEMGTRLVDLGLESAAWVFTLSDEDDDAGAHFRSLWDARALEADYRRHLRRLQQSTERLERLAVADRARETFLVGRAAMRAILVDPWLPDALVDTKLRAELVAAMRQYDRLGKACWRSFYALQ